MMNVVNIITYNGFGINGTKFPSSSNNRGRDIRASQYRKIGNDTDALASSSGLQSRGTDRFFDDGNSGISGIAYNLSSEDVKRGLARLLYKSLSFDFIYGDRHKEDPLTRTVPNNLHLRTQPQYNKRFAHNMLSVLGRGFLGQHDFSQAFLLRRRAI